MSFREEAMNKASRILRFWNALCQNEQIEKLPAIMAGSPYTLRRSMGYLMQRLPMFRPTWQRDVVEELIKDAIALADSYQSNA